MTKKYTDCNTIKTDSCVHWELIALSIQHVKNVQTDRHLYTIIYHFEDAIINKRAKLLNKTKHYALLMYHFHTKPFQLNFIHISIFKCYLIFFNNQF